MMKCMFVYSIQSITQMASSECYPPLVGLSGLQNSSGCEMVCNQLFLDGWDHCDGLDGCLQVKWGCLAQASGVISVVFFIHDIYSNAMHVFFRGVEEVLVICRSR